jgi:hypothetical protein
VEEYYAFGTNQTPYSSSAMYSGLYGAVPTACALGRHATPSRRQQVVALQLLVPLAKTLQRLAQTVIVEGSPNRSVHGSRCLVPSRLIERERVAGHRALGMTSLDLVRRAVNRLSMRLGSLARASSRREEREALAFIASLWPPPGLSRCTPGA